MSTAPPPDETQFRRFVDEYRDRCLWFTRPDYYPQTPAERAEVLRQIEQRGDRDAQQRVAAFRQWLSVPFSETSAGS